MHPIRSWFFPALILLLIICSCKGEDPVLPPSAPSGAILVKVTPDSLSSPWLLTGPNLFSLSGSGSDILLDKIVGNYRIYWQGLDGWINPQPNAQAATLTEGDTLTFNHAYTTAPLPLGTLAIHYYPPNVPLFWEVTCCGDSNFFVTGEGDTLLRGLPENDYTVTLTTIPGFLVSILHPGNLTGNVATVSVRHGISNNVVLNLLPDESNMGTITITVEPKGLSPTWTLAGPLETIAGQGAMDSYFVPLGSYYLTWEELEGWISPDPQAMAADLSAGGTLAFQRQYLSLTPLAVPVLSAQPGEQAGEVVLAWDQVEHTMYPIVSYLIVASNEGFLNQNQWETAKVIAEVDAVSGQLPYTQIIDTTAYRFDPGSPIWVAIQARDNQGQDSPYTSSAPVQLTFIGEISGTVTGYRGLPMVGLPLTLDIEHEGGSFETTTNARGEFHFSEIVSQKNFSLQTRANNWQPDSWFDYRVESSFEFQPLEYSFGLVPQHQMDTHCSFSTPDFLTYLRAMTNTDYPTSNRPNTNLYKWDHWPLTVYLPEDDTAPALDFQALSRTAIEIWNTTMPEISFTETNDPDHADVVFVYSDEYPNFNGLVSVLEPRGNFSVGNVIPQKMEVYLHNTMDIEQRVTEVALHELGHVLGIADHSTCSDAGYLMYITSAGALDNGPEHAIHPDEQVLVETIRHLPQGLDMTGFQK